MVSLLRRKLKPSTPLTPAVTAEADMVKGKNFFSATMSRLNLPLPQAASASAMPEGISDLEYRPEEGHLGNLTVQQQHILQKFRKQLEEEGIYVPERHDDANLLRFLRARKVSAREFDLPRSYQMLVEHEQWRKEFGVDDVILTDKFHFYELSQVNKFYPQYYHKTDGDGRPLYIERLEKLGNVKETLFRITTKERLLNRLVFEYERFLTERLPACSEAVGHPVETSCTILDLKGVSFYSVPQPIMDYIRAASAIGQNQYPETMGRFYIINAPRLFTTVWWAISKFLDKVTVDKIKIMGGPWEYVPGLLRPREEWINGQKVILPPAIPAENFPSELMPTPAEIPRGADYSDLHTCNCPGGCQTSNAGPWNPETKKQEQQSAAAAAAETEAPPVPEK